MRRRGGQGTSEERGGCQWPRVGVGDAVPVTEQEPSRTDPTPRTSHPFHLGPWRPRGTRATGREDPVPQPCRAVPRPAGGGLGLVHSVAQREVHGAFETQIPDATSGVDSRRPRLGRGAACCHSDPRECEHSQPEPRGCQPGCRLQIPSPEPSGCLSWGGSPVPLLSSRTVLPSLGTVSPPPRFPMELPFLPP